MADFDVDRERLLVFHVGDEYIFSHYFDRTDVFETLREYYRESEYRFEIPADEFDQVRESLREAYFEPVVVDDLEPYCVVTGKYDEHADVLRESVANWERRGHRFFLMKSDLAVKEALEAGATPIEDTDFALGL